MWIKRNLKSIQTSVTSVLYKQSDLPKLESPNYHDIHTRTVDFSYFFKHNPILSAYILIHAVFVLFHSLHLHLHFSNSLELWNNLEFKPPSGGAIGILVCISLTYL